jgi:hypothetical protein
MMRSARSARRILAFTAAAGFIGSGLLAWQLVNAERGLEGSFRQALAQGGPQLAKTVADASLPSTTFGAGLWLSELGSPAASDEAQSMTVGSHITILARDGEARHLEVVDVRPASSRTLHPDASPTAMVLVTLRPVGQAVGGDVRILVEAGSAPRLGASPARTL